MRVSGRLRGCRMCRAHVPHRMQRPWHLHQRHVRLRLALERPVVRRAGVPQRLLRPRHVRTQRVQVQRRLALPRLLCRLVSARLQRAWRLPARWPLQVLGRLDGRSMRRPGMRGRVRPARHVRRRRVRVRTRLGRRAVRPARPSVRRYRVWMAAGVLRRQRHVRLCLGLEGNALRRARLPGRVCARRVHALGHLLLHRRLVG